MAPRADNRLAFYLNARVLLKADFASDGSTVCLTADPGSAAMVGHAEVMRLWPKRDYREMAPLLARHLRVASTLADRPMNDSVVSPGQLVVANSISRSEVAPDS